MKMRFLVCAAVVLGLVGVSGPRVLADGDHDSGQIAVLAATTNAPAGAMGFASFSCLRVTPDDGGSPTTNAATLKVVADGLLVGTYTISVTDAATNTYVLGTFDVVTVTNQMNVIIGPQRHHGPGPAATTIGSGDFSLPSGLDATNVVGVTVADATSAVDLAGAFQIPVEPTHKFHKTAHLIATTNAPVGAVGFASLSSTINASTLRVTADGLLVGTYTVSITDVETNTYILGTFDVVTVTNQMYAPEQEMPGKPPSIIINIGSGSFPLPSGLDATNVVGVTVADATNLVDLAGAFQIPGDWQRELHEFIVLTSTTNAPDGAMGRAGMEIESNKAGTTNTATLEVEASGLLVGTYTVSIIDVATNAYTLGMFDVSVHTNRCDKPQPQCVMVWTNTCAFGEAEFSLPTDLDPTSVVTVTVSDTHGLVDLTGDFTNPTKPAPCTFNTVVPLTPGPSGTHVAGSAQLSIKILKGKTHAKFSLTASGVPANTKMSLVVNGTTVGTIKSNRHGSVTLKKLPKNTDLTGLTSVQAEDNSGQVVFSASF
ncbi:MAG: hypothetical protein ABSC38_06975 [Verrucomicrobiia bacterium]